ncbi:MAG: LptF/LptG family permease [Candidatus Coatesbacteria bacterium]|nr:MAG: LptF/LptG family permease [Candidatus Coatesbacteria bacterium]
MKIIDRYILRELVGPFFSAALITTGMLMLSRIFKMVELIITRGVELLTVAELFAYLVPWLMQYTVPMAALVATLMAFGRLSGDNEVVALKSSGVGLYRLAVPALGAALLLSAGMYFFDDRVVPASNYKFRELLFHVSAARPDLELKERVFISDFPGYEVYIGKIDPATGRLYEITIFHEKEGTLDNIIIAREGEIVPTEGLAQLTLRLYDGEMHKSESDKPGTYRRLRFQEQLVNLPFGDVAESAEFAKSDTEMTGRELGLAVRKLDEGLSVLDGLGPSTYIAERHREEQREGLVRKRSAFLVEVYKKGALPLACAAFVLIGVPMGVVTRRSGKGANFGVSIFFFLAYYVGLLGGESFGDRGILPAWFAVWIPNAVMCGLGTYLLYKAANEVETLTWVRKLIPSKEWLKVFKRGKKETEN